jgi:hypothetical protein
MKLMTYILGSFYIVRSIFRFSEKATDYLFKNNVIPLPESKHEKINEVIYSSIHSIVVSTMSIFSITGSVFQTYTIKEMDNSMQYLTTSICFSYFLIDLFQCLYHKKYLFIIHHLASIYLLLLTFYSYHLNENKGFYAMYLIFLLESNTILLNMGYLLKELKFHYSITCTMWIFHLICFFLFRLITIPKIIIMYYIYEDITYISLMQIPAFILILSGSVYWSYRQSVGIKKYLKENCVI